MPELERVVGKTFRGETVSLDGKQFEGCTFENCTLEFGATAPVSLMGNMFGTNCKWSLVGAAALTMDFMEQMYQGMGPVGAKLVENTFRNIQRKKTSSA